MTRDLDKPIAPQDPDFDPDAPQTDAQQTDSSTDGGAGGAEVSEVSGMEAASAGEEIMPDQAVAGAPDADSGEAQEGATGPNARLRHNSTDQDEPEQEPARKG